MKRKTILILISLLHICVFCIAILIFFQTRQTSHTDSSLVSEATVRITETEPDTFVELSSIESFSIESFSIESFPIEENSIESFSAESIPIEEDSIESFSTDPISTEPFIIEESAVETSSVEEISEPIPEENATPNSKPTYTFKYVPQNTLKLNIRNAPSMQGKIIGKVPPNKGGTILEFTNKDWALIEYNGTTGYSNLHCIILHTQKN